MQYLGTAEPSSLAAAVRDRSAPVEGVLLDATGTRIASARGGSGTQFASDVPTGTYHVTVTGSRAHYDLTITSNQLR